MEVFLGTLGKITGNSKGSHLLQEAYNTHRSYSNAQDFLLPG